MELHLREWVMIGSTILMLLVVGHALWLRWRSRRPALTVAIEPVVTEARSPVSDLDLLRAELPNGGGRPARREPWLAPEPTVPILVDPAGDALTARTVVEPEVETGVALADDRREKTLLRAAERLSGERIGDPRTGDPRIGDSVRSERTAARDAVRGSRGSWARAPSSGRADAEVTAVGAELIVINVLSRDAGEDEGFDGQSLVDLVTERGLKFGDMNIFHRYRDGKPSESNITYSMACAVKPGTFDLSVIGEQPVPGVTFFIRLDACPEPERTFDDMLDVARQVALELGGDLLDERRSTLTPQTVEHARERIRDFTRKYRR